MARVTFSQANCLVFQSMVHTPTPLLALIIHWKTSVIRFVTVLPLHCPSISVLCKYLELLIVVLEPFDLTSISLLRSILKIHSSKNEIQNNAEVQNIFHDYCLFSLSQLVVMF